MSSINLLALKLLLLFVFGNLMQVDVPAENYAISFKIKNAGTVVEGTFKGLKVKYAFDKNNLKSSFFEGSLAVSSISSGINLRDNHLKKTEYFDVSQFPIITLKTQKIVAETGNNYKITCTISMKGVTKTLIIPAKISSTGSTTQVSSSFEIDRLDFGVGRPSIVMAKNVAVEIDIKLN